VIDHLGLPQPHEPPPPAQPFADLPKLLALAAHDNVAVKVSGAARWRTSPFRTAISGIRSAGSSTLLASTVACGAPTGPAQSEC
jgi:hypothetical protein